MGKWLRNILALVIDALLLWYLAAHWNQLKSLLRLGPGQVAAMCGLWFVFILVRARIVQELLRPLNIRAGFWDMVWLNNAALLLNYAMKFGTVFRANYLKHHYGLAYSHFAMFFAYVTFLMVGTASLVGLVSLVVVYGLAGYESKVLAVVFAATTVVAGLLLFVPLPIPAGAGRMGGFLRRFLDGREQVSRNKKAVVVTALLLAVNFALTAARLAIIYEGIGTGIHPAGYLILGALGVVTLFIGLTPGALGIREVALTFGAVVLGVPTEVGVLAAMLDRAVTVGYAFVVGGICALMLWRKSPTDFEKEQAEPALSCRGDEPN